MMGLSLSKQPLKWTEMPIMAPAIGLSEGAFRHDITLSTSRLVYLSWVRASCIAYPGTGRMAIDLG